MNNAAWSRHDLDLVLDKLGVSQENLLFLHSNLGHLGKCEEDNVKKLIVDKLKERITEKGGLIVPAFTYSAPSNEIYDRNLKVDVKSMGLIPEFCQRQGFIASEDPIFRVLGWGKEAENIINQKSNRSFGKNSAFNQMLNRGITLVSICSGAGATLIHEIEYQLKVPYRFEKKYWYKCVDTGSNKIINSFWTSYVRDLNVPETEAQFTSLTKELLSEGHWKKEKLGKGYIGVSNSWEVFEYLKSRLIEEPNLLTKKYLLKQL